VSGIGETQFSIDDVRQALDELYEEMPIVTTADVADRVGCTRETARVKLNELEGEGIVVSRRVGASAKIWHPSEWQPDALHVSPLASEQTETGGDSASEQTPSAPEQTAGERVLFFPSRREIVVHQPSDRTRSILSQAAHLVDSTGQGFLYKVDTEDVWNAPYETFEGLRDDLRAVVGEDDWDGGFESRISDDWERAQMFHLRTHEDGYTVLEARDRDVFENVAKRKLEHNDHYTQYVGDTGMRLKAGAEGAVKEHLYEEGYPPVDERRLEAGADLDIELVDDIELRDYQQNWVQAFIERGSGVFVGPSGSGKTIGAIGAMAAVGGETLIIVPSRELAQQWESELLEKTTLRRRQIGQYHGGEKRIRPVTIATYDTAAMSRHRKLFNEREWALVVADECHHAVANTWKRFRDIQSTARLGLSATPVRESGDAREIYTLIGPPVGTDWGRLFDEGWVEKPDVELILVPWASSRAREKYRSAEGNQKLIEAARNPKKVEVIRELIGRHQGQKALIFVDWLKQGRELADEIGVPFISGETRHSAREDAYQQLRNGELQALIVSRVGDEGIDLPDAEVAILASTMGSSRAQTGQRSGRTMRPEGESQVYLVLTKGSGEEDWGRNSTQYLAEKGIDVTKRDWS
jgi:DNA excision repair protein ERCC-3